MSSIARRFAPLVVFAAALALYVTTFYPGVGGRFQYGDAAKWQFLPSVLGISHPPGSPLYVLVAYAFTRLPTFASIAQRTMLLSAFAGAGAVAYTFALVRRVTGSRSSALLGALVLATSEALWTFSTEAEVYAPLAFAFAFVLHRLVVWRETRKSVDFALFCLVYALSFGDHLLMITLLPAIAVFVLRTDPRSCWRPKNLAIVTVSIAIGLASYYWLWTRIPDAPYSEFIGKRTWSSFVDFVLGRNFREKMFHFSQRAFLFERSGWALGVLGSQTSLVGLLGIFAGGQLLWKRDRRLAELVLLAALGPFVFLIGFPDGDERGGVLPVLVPCALLFAVAFDRIRRRAADPLWALVVTVAGFLLVGIPGMWTGIHLVHFKTLAPLTREVDGKELAWDLDCVIEAADANVTIVPPWDDYGSRQIVNYYKFADPRVKAKHLEFQYFFEPWDASPSSPPRWHPQGNERRAAYVFTKGHLQELEKVGYVGETRTFQTLGKCGSTHPKATFYVARTSS